MKQNGQGVVPTPPQPQLLLSPSQMQARCLNTQYSWCGVLGNIAGWGLLTPHLNCICLILLPSPTPISFPTRTEESVREAAASLAEGKPTVASHGRLGYCTQTPSLFSSGGGACRGVLYQA